MLRFDEAALRERLKRLPPEARAAFAAACAQRLAATGRRPGLEPLLAAAWDHLLTAPQPVAELAREAERLVADADDADGWTPGHAVAENAAAAAAYALRTLATGDAQEAAWAARQAVEALDTLAAAQLGPGICDEATERALAEDPRLQAELAAQERDLAELERGGDHRAAAAMLRERAG